MATFVGALALPAVAMAGGWDKNEPGMGLDLLFDPGKLVLDASVTVQDITRVYDSYSGWSVDALTSAFVDRGSGSGLDIGTLGVRGAVALKFDPIDNTSCVAGYREPFNLHTDFGDTWAGRYKFTEKTGDVYEASLTCSYRFAVGPGFARVIGGFVHDWGSFEFSRYTPYAGFSFPTTISLEDADGGNGWRAGLAYEIPQYAFRASVLYNSGIKLDAGGMAVATGLTSYGVMAEIDLPQSVELAVQSGIAPNWLAFGSVKWTDWSVVEGIPILRKSDGAVRDTLMMYYRDGWTVTAGLGHKFTDNWSASASVIWDRGVSTGFDEYGDTYTLMLGGKFTTDDKRADLTAAIGLTAVGPVDIDGYSTGISAYSATLGWDHVVTGRLGARIRLN